MTRKGSTLEFEYNESRLFLSNHSKQKITKKLECMNAVVPDWRSTGLVKYQGRPNARNSVSGIHEYSHNTLLACFLRSNTRI